jgi:2-hydroxychromene-2-carboxylate isomerase
MSIIVNSGLPVKQRSLQRQAYRLVEMERWCKIHDIPIVQNPKFYPADPSLAHRVLLAAIEESGHDSAPVQEFARRGLETVWVDEGDIADPVTISNLADKCGLDGARLLKRAEEEKGLVEQESALMTEVTSRQVFGAPFYFYRDEPFWGQDRLDMLEEVIRSGRDAIPLPVLGN